MFKKLVTKSIKQFKQWLKEESYYRIYTHLDADGISSGLIMNNLLKSEGKNYHLTVIEQLNEDQIASIKIDGPPLILLDFGSGQLSQLKKIIEKRRVLILDHHQPQGELEHDKLIHVNPCLAGIDGGTQVSASGVTYLFSKELKPNSFNASIALIGAKGDIQDLDSSLNASIINDSTLSQRKDLNVYGLNTRAIHKAIMYSGIIPGVEDETSAVNFLTGLKIPLKDGGDWRTINDLNSEEKQRLISEIIMAKGSENIFQTVYELKIGKNRSLSEWAAVLNACGRMGLPSMGFSALLNPSYEKKIDVVLKEYRNSIAEGLRWLESNKDSVIETDKAIYFIGKNEINYKLIGTLCSIKSMEARKEFIIGFADQDDKTKVSVRRTTEQGLKASDLVIKASEGLGEGGGHAQAAGATIKKNSEQEFINKANKILETNNTKRVEVS